MAFYVDFTAGNESERLADELPDLSAAIEVGAAKQTEYKAMGKHGVISAYEISAERGFPMKKCYEFWEV